MSRRNFVLLILVLILIAGGALLYFYLHRNSPNNPTDNGGTNFFANFNPFGSKNNSDSSSEPPPADISGGEPAAGGETDVKLRKVSSMPVAGFGIFSKERFKEVPDVVPADAGSAAATSTSGGIGGASAAKKPVAPATEFATAVRYVARATGNIYQTFADKIDERQFTSTVIPQVYDAYFGANAQSVVMRYLKSDGITIETYAGSLPKEVLAADSTESNEITGSFLPEGITSLSLSPDLSKIFYLFGVGDTAAGVTAETLGDKKSQVFTSAFTEWLSDWPAAGMITLTTKPSGGIPGYAYALNPDTKSFTKILGGINGLTTLGSPDGKYILYGDDTLSLDLYNTKTKTSTSLPVRTLPEKCAWSRVSSSLYCAVPGAVPGGSYPDGWYRGEISFSDDIWKIDLDANGNATANMLADPSTVPGGEVIDGTKLALDKTENYLFFVNKVDSYLWELELK